MKTKDELLSMANSWIEEAKSHFEFWEEGEHYGVRLLQLNPKDAALVACALELRSALKDG